MDLAGFLRRALIALPFAVVITLGGLAYMIFVGSYSPYLTCTAELRHHGLEGGQFGELMKTVCTQQLEEFKKAHPDAYKCGSHCIVDAKTKEEDDTCYAKCPGFVDPLSPDSDAGVALVADADVAAIDAGVSTDGGTVPGGETYLGAIGGLPIHATLVVSDASISGRWVYEKGGGAEGLAIEAHATGTTKNHFVGTEMIADGGVSGDLSLERSGVELTGSWSKHGAENTLPILLAPEVRSKTADHVVRARRVMMKNDGLNATTNPGFLPVFDGPEATRITPSLTFKALLGDDESELVGGTITGLDFDVALDDGRLLTLVITEETMGAYPSSNVSTDTFDLETGKKIGAEALKADQKIALVHLLDKRVHDAWTTKKQELAKAPQKEGECGPDIANGFMDGSGPSFTAALLDGVAATKDGLTFDFDFGFPHVVLACAPSVDLSLSWKEASAFVDPKGPFGGR